MADPSSNDVVEDHPAPRRSGRPSFADDVYGERRENPTNPTTSDPAAPGPEFSESSLAHRRQVALLKLKQLKATPTAAGVGGCGTSDSAHALPRPESIDISERDLDFKYTDCDNLSNELAELYTYSELDDFAANLQHWKTYADEHNVDAPFNFSSLPEARKRMIFMDLTNGMESAESDRRLNSCRILLYLLQGAFGDFSEEEEMVMEAGIQPKAPVNRGTGGYEEDCIQQGFRNAHLAFSCGVYQALCSLLLTDIAEPFDYGLSMDGRDSKASSRDSRHASNADLSEHERRRRAATLADNEALRVVLSSLYHMVELIRNDDLTSSVSDPAFIKRRAQFIEELEEPVDNHGEPLLYILFEMMPPFYTGTSPHFPIKKIMLLVWKILLAVLGGWEKLDELKIAKRSKMSLPRMENTIVIANKMAATVINDTDCGGLMAAKRGGASRMGTLALARQLACAGSDEAKDDDEGFEGSSPDETEAKPNIDEDAASNSRRGNDRQASGDRTPRAGSPMPVEPPKKLLPWAEKVSNAELDQFLQGARMKFFNYVLPGDTTTMFGIPPPILNSYGILKKHVYTSASEIEATEEENLNRFRFSRKEVIDDNATERLYQRLLPSLSQYVVAVLKVLLAAAPSGKAKSDALNILVDVLTPETDGSDVLSNSISLDHSSSNPLEDSVRLAIDINRHKEIMVKAASSVLILLCKHFRVNHAYQYEYLCQHVVFGNGIPLLLKFLDQNMTRYVQSRYEIHAYNYPQAVLHYVRNREEWPVLNSDNVEDGCANERNGVYFMWRNVFSAVNIVRVLNKLVKAKQSRIMMLMVFKSAPILKRAMKIRLGIFQLYVLKALKMQSRYLGRQWRRTNMDIISAIYNKVRHRLTDDWAFANEMRKSYDYQNEESDLKAAVERFHSRRYSKLYPNLAIEVNDLPMPGDDYLNRVDMREFEPVDSCSSSVLGIRPELGERFTKNYEKWIDEEVIRRNTDWDKLLMNTRGVFSSS